jgi:hypothetical protein
MHDFLHELLVAIAAVVMFISPCVLANLGNTERRWHREPDKDCPEVDRRDPR